MSKQLPEDYLALGRIGAAFGVKGWVKLFSFADPAKNILDYPRFMILDGSDVREIEIDQSKAHGKGFVAHIKGCDDRNETRLYTGKELLIAKAILPELDDTSYYWYQLEGLRVLNLSGDELGNVHHLMETGANDVLIVKPSDSSIDDEDRLIPYLMDRVIKNVDLQNNLITVDWGSDY